MWKTILSNINGLILSHWKTLFTFALGAAAGLFLLSCTAINSAVDWSQETTSNAVDWTQEAGTNAVDWVTGADEESEATDK